MMHRPKEVAQRLGISPATLRVWSGEFEDLLSESAGKAVTEAGTAAQRRYTDNDVALLERAAGLMRQGLTYLEARQRLQEPTTEPEPTSEPAPLMAPEATEALRLALSAQQETISTLQSHVRDLQAERDRLLADVQALRGRQAQAGGEQSRRRPWWEWWKR